MKNKIYLFAFLAFLLSTHSFAYSWMPRPTAGAYEWQAIFSSANGLNLVASDFMHVVVTSNDGGLTWTTQTDPSSRNHNFRRIAGSTNASYLAATDASFSYVYVSRDGGATWAARTFYSSPRWSSIASSADGVKLAATTGDGRLYTSTDTGNTWTLQTTGIHGWNDLASSADGMNLVAVTNNYYVGGSGDYIYTSTDGGVTWTARTASGSRNWISVASSSDGLKIIATSADSSLAISQDGGATWHFTHIVHNGLSRVASSDDGSRLFYTVYNGYIYSSTNGGTTWSAETSAGVHYWGSIATSADGRMPAAGPIYPATSYIYTTVPQNSPYFVNGRSLAFSICENATATSIDTLLTAYDVVPGLTKAWSIIVAPVHGAASVAYGTTSAGSTLIPTGLTYTPTTGYYGPDSMRLRITDGVSSDTTSVYITVGSFPPILTGPGAVCQGGTISLTDWNDGGTWTSSNSAATVSGGIIIGIAAGVDTITHAFSNSCGTGSATKIITVNPVPPTISGYSAICGGASVTFSDAVSGGTWSSSNVSVATIGSVSGLVATTGRGSATITYTLSSGCFTTMSVNVISSPPFTLLGCDNLGVGDTLIFPGTMYGGLFSTNPTVAQTMGSFEAVGMSVGTATIKLIDPITGCIIGTRNIAVTSTALIHPIGGDVPICEGGSTTLTDVTPGGTWTSGTPGVAVIGSATGAVTAISGGETVITYSVTGASCDMPFFVNSNPTPITGATRACVGDTLNLSSSAGAVNVSSVSIYDDWYGLGPIFIDGPIIYTTFASSDTTKARILGSCIGCTGTGVLARAAGTSVITFTDLYTGCAVSETVTINALPALITGPSLIRCPGGGTTTYADATTGGTWSSSATSVATIGSASGVVTPVTIGITTLTYTLSGTGCMATKPVSNILPGFPITVSPNPLCAGSSATATWLTGCAWSIAGGIASIDSVTGVVHTSSSGTATITGSYGPGCSQSQTLTVNPIPSISGAFSVCVGSSITLSGSAGGTWSSSSGNVIVGSATGSVTGVGAGVATITFTNSSGCSTSWTMTVNAAASAGIITGPSSVCTANIITLSNAVSGGFWSSGNSNAAVSAGGVVTGLLAGVDTITFAVPGICGSASVTKTITIDPTPSAAPISGSGDVCVGSVIVLTDGSAGGTWSSPAASVSVVGGTVTGLSAGVAPITYTVANVCGTAMTFTMVTINPLPNAGTIGGVLSACAGATTTLTNTTGMSGVWSSASPAIATVGSTSAIISAVAAGIDTIRYTVTNTCGTASTTAIVTVNALPAAGTISGVSHVCIGSSITLTVSVGGGAWSSSGSSLGVTGGTVMGLTAGTGIISYTVTNLCGSDAATMVVTVDPLPAAGSISGTSVLCTGSSATLSGSVSGGAWTGSSAAATISGGMVTGVSAGMYVVSYTVANGCGTNVATHAMTINAAPAAGAITGAGSVCDGAAILLTDAATGGVWSSSNATVVSVDAAGNVTGSAAGSAMIFYTVTNSCGSDTAALSITVDEPAAPLAGPSSVCRFSIITLTDATPGGSWSSGNPLAAFVLGGTVAGVSVGVTHITYTVINACGTTDAVKEISVINCSLETKGTEKITEELIVTPNPNSGRFACELQSPANVQVLFSVKDMAGRSIKTVTAVANDKLEMNPDIPAGVYILTASTPSGSYARKVVVE